MYRLAITCSATSAPTNRSAAASREDFEAADPESTGQVMEFRVIPALAPDPTTPPMFLQLPPSLPLPAETVTRPLALIEKMGMGLDAEGEMVEGPWKPCWARSRRYGGGICGWNRSPRTRPSATQRSGSSTTPPATPTRCTSTKWSSKWSTARDWCWTVRMLHQPIQLDGNITPRTLGDRLQGYGHRLPRPGHPRAGAVHTPGSSSGTVTSSNTKTTR
jgi:hypothetical protein